MDEPFGGFVEAAAQTAHSDGRGGDEPEVTLVDLDVAPLEGVVRLFVLFGDGVDDRREATAATALAVLRAPGVVRRVHAWEYVPESNKAPLAANVFIVAGRWPGYAPGVVPVSEEPAADRSVGSDDAHQERPEAVPVWDDGYIDRVGLRLAHHYDLERDHTVAGERFDLYGEMHVRHERHAIHPALTFGHHEAEEYLFARRVGRPTVTELESLEALGEDLADEQIEAHEDHYSTDFTFVLVAESLPEDIREYVAGYRNRTLLKYGYFGHYEINLVVVAPDREESVASEEADVEAAFRVWESIETPERGRLDRLLGWLSR